MKTLLICCLLFVTVPVFAQDYGIPVRLEAGPARSYGSPLFHSADSARTPARMLAGGQKCYVMTKLGPWYRVRIGEEPMYYAVASSIAIPGYPGFETAAPCAEANAVVAYLDEAPADAWRKTCQALLTNGYTLAQRDADLQTFATAAKPMGRTAQLTITGFVQPGPGGKGSAVTISGAYTYLAVAMGSLYQANVATVARPAVFRGGQNNADRMAFSAMDEVAHAVPGARIKYAVR